jgi:hypothetical protein
MDPDKRDPTRPIAKDGSSNTGILKSSNGLTQAERSGRGGERRPSVSFVMPDGQILDPTSGSSESTQFSGSSSSRSESGRLGLVESIQVWLARGLVE